MCRAGRLEGQPIALRAGSQSRLGSATLQLTAAASREAFEHHEPDGARAALPNVATFTLDDRPTGADA